MRGQGLLERSKWATTKRFKTAAEGEDAGIIDLVSNDCRGPIRPSSNSSMTGLSVQLTTTLRISRLASGSCGSTCRERNQFFLQPDPLSVVCMCSLEERSAVWVKVDKSSCLASHLFDLVASGIGAARASL